MMSKRSRALTPPDDLIAFIGEQYGRVFGALVLYTGDRALAEDLTQETFVRVCRDWSTVAVMAAPGPWTHRVAMNLADSSHRRRGAERRAAARARGRRDHTDVTALPHGGTDVRSAVLDLDDDERAVIVLRYFVDLSVDETASTLGIPVGTVKSRSRRAVERLRSSGVLAEELADE